MKYLKIKPSEFFALYNLGRHIGNAARLGMTFNFPDDWTDEMKREIHNSFKVAKEANFAVTKRSEFPETGVTAYPVMSLDIIEEGAI